MLVGGGINSGRADPALRDLDARQRVPTNEKFLNNFSVFDDLDAVAGLFDDGARIAADE